MSLRSPFPIPFGWFQVGWSTDLKPGRYLLLCAMPEDEGRHYELGMIYRFTIE